jgi:hypothetical protein
MRIGFFFFFTFSAQKTRVKPQNHSTPYQTTTSTWHFSFTPSAILDIEIRKEENPRTPPGDIYLNERILTRNSFTWNNLDATAFL